MKRDKSSHLGDRQAEGNLGSERVRNSADEGSRRERSRTGERSSEVENWSPESDAEDIGDERTDGSER